MKIGVLGTGTVGRVIGARFVALGHDVAMARGTWTRSSRRKRPARSHRRRSPTGTRRPPEVSLGSFAEAAEHGELLVNATNGAGSLDALRAAGEQNLERKVLIDIANPLDVSGGMPPSLFVSNTDSLGEQIQRAFPGVRVVEALNTMNAFVMADPSLVADGDHSVFVCGNDAHAKEQVVEILRSFGWRDVIVLGDITSARGGELSASVASVVGGAPGPDVQHQGRTVIGKRPEAYVVSCLGSSGVETGATYGEAWNCEHKPRGRDDRAS